MNSFCKIYISSKTNERDIWKVANAIKMPFLGNVFVYLDVNEEFDADKEILFPDGFLFFKFLLEIELKNEAMNDDYIKYIGLVLKELWKKGISAVASSDFEMMLPNNGGYNSKEVSW